MSNNGNAKTNENQNSGQSYNANNTNGNNNAHTNGGPNAGSNGYNRNNYNQNNYDQGNYSQGGYGPSTKQYPKRKSTVTIIVALALILMGVSYIINTFLPWVFAWIDSGLVIAVVAIIAGFGLLLRR